MVMSEYERTLRNLQGLLGEAVKQTQRFDAKWNRVNDEINAKLDAERVTDIVQRNKIKSASLPLADALGSGNWWRAKATYLATVVQAEIALQNELTRLARGRERSS